MGFRPWNMYGYFEWLCHRVNGLDMIPVMQKLHNRQFTWIDVGNLRRDENREVAGRALRQRFLNEMSVPDIFGDMNVPASVLEVLVALAEDIDDKLAGDGSGERIELYFFEMLSNLWRHRDVKFEEIDDILDTWLDRKFEWNGTGSPFPIHNGCKYDQRKVELWLQACGYYSQELR